MKKILFIALLPLLFFSCQKKKITSAPNNIIGNWQHLAIMHVGSTVYVPSSDRYVLHITADSIQEWNASYMISGNTIDVYFSDINYHEIVTFTRIGNSLTLIFSNGSRNKYGKT